ncbi:uncharacterized protein EMH_0082630 [Eimeria mitis]|uniref:Uncharacterized protein n=1 Tax=Eimeria mitis TaxID=44415 RepID=U6KB61_9EIME|nr:uncharacterized protein EMH_0082630 [Eimeria mitis]CDJ33447.1 hypothetical protein EMH_0082630 [Eimeria mitis]
MSVGLPDVPSVSFSDVATVSPPLKELLPRLQLLQAEASLVVSLVKGDREQRDSADPQETADAGTLDALETVARIARASPPPSCLLMSPSQRLLYVLQQLLRLMNPHSLQQQLVQETPVSCPLQREEAEIQLAPAGEFLLEAMRLCLQQHADAAAATAAAVAARRQQQQEGDSSLQGTPGDTQRDTSIDTLTQNNAKEPNTDASEGNLTEYLLRLRAEREALETLQSFAAAAAAAASPATTLFSLEQLLASPSLHHLEALKAPEETVYRELFYHCLLRCFAVFTAPSPATLFDCLRLQLATVCREMLQQAGLQSLCLLELVSSSSKTKEETTPKNQKEAVKKHLLLPPKSCDAKETLSPAVETPLGVSCSCSIPQELKALDEELRPSRKGDRQKWSLLRLLAKWLRTPAWRQRLRGGDNDSGDSSTANNEKGDTPLPPLLLPYGSSVTRFGDWASDLDLALLLPSRCSTGASKETLQHSSCCSRLSPSSPCCLLCGQERDCPHDFLSKADAAAVLTRLEGLLRSEVQLEGLFTCLDVVVPQRAPPVLRGVYRHPRGPQRRPSKAASCCSSASRDVSPNGESPRAQNPSYVPSVLGGKGDRKETGRDSAGAESSPKEASRETGKTKQTKVLTAAGPAQGGDSRTALGVSPPGPPAGPPGPPSSRLPS